MMANNPWRTLGLVLIAWLLPQVIFAQQPESFKPFKEFLDSQNQDFHLQIAAVAEPEIVNPGDTFRVRLTLEFADGWHIYAMKLAKEDALLSTQVQYEKNIFPPAADWEESPPKLVLDRALEKVVSIHSRMAEFSRVYTVPVNLNPGRYQIKGAVVYRACDNKVCKLPSKMPFQTSVRVQGQE